MQARDNLRGVETPEDVTIGSKSEYVNEPKPVEPMEHQGETGLVYGYCHTAHPSVDWERWVWPMSGGVTRGVWHWPQGRVSSNYRIVVSAVEL